MDNETTGMNGLIKCRLYITQTVHILTPHLSALGILGPWK